MRPRFRAFAAAYLPLVAGFAAALLLLTWASPVLAADTIPAGAQKALAPVTKMIATLVAIAIGLGIAICGAVIVWGGIEKTLAGANTDAEHRAQKRITNGIMGLVWMVLAGVIVSPGWLIARPARAQRHHKQTIGQELAREAAAHRPSGGERRGMRRDS